MVPGQGPPHGPPGPGAQGRPGMGCPTGTFAPPPPQVSYPHPGPHYAGVVPSVVPPPGVPYGTPMPSGSPVIPSPPSTGGDVFVPPEYQFRDSHPPLPHGVYQPPVPIPLGEEDIFIPPEPSPQGSFRSPTPSKTPTTELSPHPESGIPLVIPGPHSQLFPQPQLQPQLQLQPSGTQPPMLAYPPSQGSQYHPLPSRPTSRSTDRTSPPLPVATQLVSPCNILLGTTVHVPPHQPTALGCLRRLRRLSAWRANCTPNSPWVYPLARLSFLCHMVLVLSCSNCTANNDHGAVSSNYNRPKSPEYRPESPRSGFVPPSSTPTHYMDHPVHPVGAVPTGGPHIVLSEPYPRSRQGWYSGLRTPSSGQDREDSCERCRLRHRRAHDQTPSTDTEEEERR